MENTLPPIPEKTRGVLRWAAESLLDLYGSRLKHLILFGSYARGEAKSESDVDLLVVLEGPVRSYEEAKRTSRIGTRAAAYQDTALSFVHMSAEDFEDDRRPLVQSAKAEGIDLLKTPLPGSAPTSSQALPSEELATETRQAQ
jgi:predicted nucleotidyltransferase